ncbi:uncharacterized protein Z520_10456 [Fonsecaea multimorphosa CBS 102226]|uniref:GATA-type domain-containing protein n=1 Tax=Fonsecaea multimorphosa CBS 102226 TaxID=1442371 RepID=A0A0D2I9I2_9EURO|nr:uncharacterized protein Z520_10456 [Fonsecaea multimorphosa CBS 102226]KIX93831.1 hypothetical protein Z520_10456 [Fonsecaea multimorphosa CBS 102226]OAL19071.1 hypothetical protein AYO22_10019 [Fonsecaea multimorphosa]
MATIEAAPRPRDTLPSISHLDLDTIRSERNDLSRYSIGSGLSISTAPLASPTASMYSGQPQPYSCAPSTAGSVTGVSGYISPPESTTRRSTRDEKESPDLRKSLPSIHEALGDKSMPFSGSSQHQLPTPSAAVGPSFSDGPKGPVNPFSQPAPSVPALRDVFSAPQMTASTPTEPQTAKPPFPPPSVPAPDPRQPVSQTFGYPGSPSSQQPSNFRSASLANTTFTNHNEAATGRSPQTYEPPRQQQAFPPFSNPTSSNALTSTNEVFQFTAGSKPANEVPYNEAVKRHLEVFDAELGINEIGEASLRTLEFCRTWGPRIHQGSRSGYVQENLPPGAELDDLLRQTHRTYELFSYLREMVVAQENAKAEQARLARGAQAEEEYQGTSDEYKNGGYSGGDAKKRRGKAAPPGRCHSCNRAETPEWRRGPDGARTLCNACGLHYAKLTRKLGVNKAAAMTGANLRPKNADSTRP